MEPFPDTMRAWMRMGRERERDEEMERYLYQYHHNDRINHTALFPNLCEIVTVDGVTCFPQDLSGKGMRPQAISSPNIYPYPSEPAPSSSPHEDVLPPRTYVCMSPYGSAEIYPSSQPRPPSDMVPYSLPLPARDPRSDIMTKKTLLGR